MFKKKLNMIAAAIAVLATPAVYAQANNFNCPAPEEIHSTDFTSPSIWVAPPMAHSVPGEVGVGLGGSKVKKLIGVEKAKVNHGDGWVCVYKTDGTAVNEYEKTIRKIVVGNKFLIKYLEKFNEAFDAAEPYLKHYPKGEPIGFVGYQLENQQQQQQQQQQQKK